MGLFTRFALLGFAILIANPLCCCSVALADEESKVHTCCEIPASGDQSTPEDSCPGCQSKFPRAADGGKTLLLSVEWFEWPVPVGFEKWSPSQPAVPSVHPEIDRPGAPPPRQRLVLHQRFLI